MYRFRLFLIALYSLLFVSNAATAGGLVGDAKALARLDAMFETLGGRDTWASARSLYTMERARHPKYGDGIVAVFWRDLAEPGEYARMSHEKFEIKYAWDESGGWLLRDGELRDFSDDEMAERRFYWHREIYTLYHQLAQGKRKLTLKSVEPNGFLVMDEQGEKISEFMLTADGDLYMWRQLGGDDPVAYVYGPHKDFGKVSFPDWGTSTDGGWGFYYVQVKPSSKSFASHVDITPPNQGWAGGAIKKDQCEP